MTEKDFIVKNGIIVNDPNAIRVGNTSYNVVISTTSIVVGNSASNSVINSTAVIIGGTTVGYGYTGSKGYTGSAGEYGGLGYTGSKGDIGYSGSLGYTGSTGAGYTGSASTVIGYTGSRGNIGYTGSIGIGYTGSASTVIGYTGSRGATGYAGSIGADGLGFTWRGTWAGSTNYYVNDVVAYNNSSYICIQDVYNVSPANATYWTLLAPQGESGYVGSRGDIGYTGSASTVVGYTGSEGPAGAGYTGSASDVPGYTGSQGSIGYTGSKGEAASLDPANLTQGTINPKALYGTTVAVTANTLTLDANTHMGVRIRFANTGATSCILPNSFPAEWNCMWEQRGTGQVTFTPASGANRRNRSGDTKSAGQYAQGSLYVDSNSGGASADWTLAGDTA